MKTEKEIRKELDSIKADIDKVNDGTENILQGWVEALEYVLKDTYDRELLPDILSNTLTDLENEVYYDLGYKHTSGGYVNTTIIDETEIPDPDDPVEDVEVYVVKIESGIDGEGVKTICHAYIRKDDYEIIYDVD